MAAETGFDTYYGNHPWAGMSQNQRDWYVPDLLAAFRTNNIYQPFVPMRVDLAAQRTKQMIFTLLYDLEPDTDALGLRDIWLESMQWDSAQVTIDMEHHGSKVAYHKYDDIITFWQQNRDAGLRRICRGSLGKAMSDHLDILARNAFLSTSYNMYTGQASGTGFGDLASTNLFDIKDIMEIWLGLAYREVPLANNPVGGPDGMMMVLTTPGVIFDIQDQADGQWQTLNTYSEAGRAAALKYEVGSYKNARFLRTSRNTLWNCGTQSIQSTVTSSVSAGDGAAATVDSVYSVGQSGATAYLQLSAFDAGDYAVNDIVTIHTIRTSSYGVTNAPDHTSGKTAVRRVVSVDASNNQISLDKPLLRDYDTDLGGGVYAYVTKGMHIHASVCIAGPAGVVAGVGQPPQVYNPPQVEDIPSIHRFSWDALMKYQLFRPEMFEVIYSAGNVRLKGNKTTG